MGASELDSAGGAVAHSSRVQPGFLSQLILDDSAEQSVGCFFDVATGTSVSKALAVAVGLFYGWEHDGVAGVLVRVTRNHDHDRLL